MKVCIITTYPEHGTKNIGDQLITLRTCEYIKSVFGEGVGISLVWRAEDWANASKVILESDLVVFACLAIRKKMTEVEYPYLWKVLNSGKPFVVLAAGTSLSPTSENGGYSAISSDSLKALRKINENAVTFTTRGVLSQGFCKHHGLDKAVFAGDIAFYDKRFFGLKFPKACAVKKIAISDPHGGLLYWRPLKFLVDDLSQVFPGAEIKFFMHGENASLLERLRQEGYECVEIYRDKDHGLEGYDDIDLHVGFRVHGHVSALARRKPSYLLEQDGRGCDYGLTFNANISVPCYMAGDRVGLIANLLSKRLGVGLPRLGPGSYPAIKIMSMIREDASSDFSKFELMERQLLSFTSFYDSEGQKIFDRCN